MECFDSVFDGDHLVVGRAQTADQGFPQTALVTGLHDTRHGALVLYHEGHCQAFGGRGIFQLGRKARRLARQ